MRRAAPNRGAQTAKPKKQGCGYPTCRMLAYARVHPTQKRAVQIAFARAEDPRGNIFQTTFTIGDGLSFVAHLIRMLADAAEKDS